MALQIKVKTLDSQNYDFQAERDWTVSRFKEHIQETVNVPAPEQRLIFCGRVLQNDKKLTEYDVDGKVIHLVRRPPPTSDQPDNDPLANGATDSNSTGNDAAFPQEFRFGEDNNVLFSAMTLGPDGNMNQIVRHIMTLQQALYARAFEPALGGANGGASDPEFEIIRRVHNAARLLRITYNLIYECSSRLPPTSPIVVNGTITNRDPSTFDDIESGINLPPTQSGLSAAFSQEDLQANDHSTSATEISNADSSRMTVDDSSLGRPSTSLPTSRQLPRQALTTDDLPHNNSARPSIGERRARDIFQNGQPTGAQADEFYLERYMILLGYSNDIHSQLQVLVNRYSELISMSRRGGLVMSNATTSADTQEGGQEPASAPLSAQELADGNNETAEGAATTRSEQYNISEALRREARVLNQYVPRILHHHSHLQHALSDFTVDFTRGRLLFVTGHPQQPHVPTAQGRPRYVTRQSVGPRPPQVARSETLSRRSARRTHPILGGSVTITATTAESPIISTTTTIQPQTSATIVVSAQPGQSQIHIPVNLGPGANLNAHIADSLLMGISQQTPPQNNGGTASSGEASQLEGQTQQQQQQPQQPQQQQQQQPQQPQQSQPQQDDQRQPSSRTGQETTSNSTQTGSRPFGIISGRIPLPFDYYLTCFSPYAHYNVPSRAIAPADPAPGSRVQTRSVRQQESAPRNNARPPGEVAYTQMADPVMIARPLDGGLAEVVSNTIGSIYRPVTIQPQPPPTTQNESTTTSTNPPQDPFMNMISELVVNAASQILGGVFGIQTDANSPPGSQQARSQQEARPQQASTSVMMDIDIDDNYSSQSESAYQDARESQPTATASRSQTSERHADSQFAAPQEQYRIVDASGSARSYSHEQVAAIFRNHPDWVPIIEADIRTMERQRSVPSSTPAYLSDAYLASIPRKRRRLLVSNPERVLILQPSPSEAIASLLHRAIASSNLSINQQGQVLAGIASDQELQNAYEDYLRSAVVERLRTDEDFSETKYKNSSRYFK